MKDDSFDLALIVNSNAYGGTERHTLDLLSKISEKSVKSVFVYSGEGFNSHLPNEYSSVNFSKVESKVQNLTLDEIKTWRTKLRKLNAKRAVLIKPSYFSIDLKFLLLVRTHYKNLTVIEHSLPPERPSFKRFGFIPKIGFWRLQNELKRYLFAKLVDKVITVSELSKSELEKQTFYNDIRVCGNGINLDYWATDNTKGKDFRSNHFIDSDLYLFGCVGNLFPVKSFDVAIRALSLISKKNKNRCGLCIVGVGPEEQRLKELATNLNVDNVFFVGKQIDMVAAYSAIQTLLITSKSESASLALLEATACDCNILASNVGICNEVIEEMSNGAIIRSHEPEAWAEAIEVHLNENKFLDDAFRPSQKPEFKQKYDTKKTMDRLLNTIMSEN